MKQLLKELIDKEREIRFMLEEGHTTTAVRAKLFMLEHDRIDLLTSIVIKLVDKERG